MNTQPKLTLIIATEPPPLVRGLTQAARPKTLRTMPAREALNRRLEWMRGSFKDATDG